MCCYLSLYSMNTSTQFHRTQWHQSLSRSRPLSVWWHHQCLLNIIFIEVIRFLFQASVDQVVKSHVQLIKDEFVLVSLEAHCAGRFAYIPAKRVRCNFMLGPIYTKRQRQRKVNAAMILVIQLSLKSMEAKRVAPEWGCNPFWSDSIDFNDSHATSVITPLTLRWRWRFV